MAATFQLSGFVAGLFFILLGIILGRITNNLIKRALSKISLNDIFFRLTNKKINLEGTIALVVSIVIYVVSIVLGLNFMGITHFILNLLSIIIIVILIGFFLLSLKDVLPNLFAGMYLLSKKNFKQGMNIRINNIKGIIQEIELVETKILTDQNDVLIIPNSEFIRNAVLIINEATDEKQQIKQKTKTRLRKNK